MKAPPPGAASNQWVETLARTECPSFTTRRARRAERSGANHDPIVWREARGSNVVDADGNRYVDLTSGFGAAAIGHRHPTVVRAVQQQSGKLLHALGDLQPSDVKIELLDRLASLAPFPDARIIIGLSGSDAVEAALKSAALSTGRPGVLAFEGAYHGLSHGPLALCGYRESFRSPFAKQLNPHVTFLPFPDRDSGLSTEDAMEAILGRWPAEPPGALVIEPILGRGGVRVPPAGFLGALAKLARERGVRIVADEVLTGLGRTGTVFRSVAEGMDVDLLCIGKALGGGLPISACLGRAEVMDAWGDPGGEAIHTGTFFGNPLSCAAALASLSVLEEEDLARRAKKVGERLQAELCALSERHPALLGVRGAGLLTGVVLGDGSLTLRVVRRLLELGYLALPAGSRTEVLQILPALNIDWALLEGFVASLDMVLGEMS